MKLPPYLRETSIFSQKKVNTAVILQLLFSSTKGN